MAFAAPAQAVPSTAKAWGANTEGQLGDGTTEGPEICSPEAKGCSTTPVEVSKLTGVTTMSAGGGETENSGWGSALLDNGTVMAWGRNQDKELGNGTTINSDVPVEVMGLSEPVTAISAGPGEHSLALLKNGTVVSWGHSFFFGASHPPEAVSGLSGVKAVAAGRFFSLGLLENGTVVAWGNNGNGKLGDGTTADSESPVHVCAVSTVGACPTGPYLEGVKAIAASNEHALALLENGTVVAWGSNHDGDLGNGTETNSDVPVAVTGLSKVKAISADESDSLALLENGAVMAWGSNIQGQLGGGTSTGPETCGEAPFAFACSKKPAEVSGLSGVTSIAAGRAHNLALLENTTVKAWGSNTRGQLGDGSSVGPEVCGPLANACSTKPVDVVKLSGVAGISAKGDLSLAFGPPPAVTNVNPSHGPPAGSTTATITGTGFTGASAVKFGSTNATSFTVNSATSITAVSPAGTGVVDVTVTNAWGASATSSADQFSYEPPPTVTGVEPSHGPAAGGTSVTITGTNFTGASAVKFGSANATSFTVKSEGSITAVSPVGTGTVDVTVTTPSGTSATSSADRFTYGPTVSKVEPNHGSPSGGTTVTITGTGFTGATAVKFGASNATKVTVSSATSITAVSAKAMGAGTVNVIVMTAAGTSPTSTADQFTYMKK
jgi:alpha-tubulin suppressor-like RCC1 family protein